MAKILLLLACLLPLTAGMLLTACHRAEPTAGGQTVADGAGIQGLLDQAKAERRAQVVIPPGIYRLPVPAATAAAHLRLADCDDLTVIMDGVTLVVPEPTKPTLMIERCRRVVWRGTTFVRPAMIHSQGTITALSSDRRQVEVRIARGYPANLDDPRAFSRIPVINLFHPTRREWKAGTPDLYVAKHELIGPDTVRFHLRAPADSAWSLAVGDRAAWRGLGGRGHDVVQRWTEGVVMQAVTIRNGAGMSFQELCGNGGNRYEGCVITYGDRPAGADEDPLLANSVDGLHSSGLRIGPQVIGCRFEGLNDDGVAIHGAYALAVALVPGRSDQVVVDTWPIHRGQPESQFCAVGDRIRLLGPDLTVRAARRVTGVEERTGWQPDPYPRTNASLFRTSDHREAKYRLLTLDGPLPDDLVPGCYVENVDAIGEGFTVRDCVITDKRAHGLFIKAGAGVIEGNRIESNLMGAIVVAPEVDAWTESGYAENLLIRGNTLRRCGIGTQDWNGIITVAGFERGAFLPLPGGHRDIRIIGNRFEGNDGTHLVLTSIQGLTLSGNEFIRPMHQPVFPTPGSGIDRTALVWIASCQGVSARHNRIQEAGPCLAAPVAGPGGALLPAEAFAHAP